MILPDDAILEGTQPKILAPALRGTMGIVKDHVLNKEWDYVCIVAGVPGSGKSTFARGAAKFCCPWFSMEDIVFTADDFIKRTSTCPDFTAIVYDECFEAMNSRTSMSLDFQRIVNHLQLLRKRHLFIFLCLPNFFDLSKTISIFRTRHLFYTYVTSDGIRGKVAVFGVDNKRELYVRGQKFVNYNAYKANFVTKFMKNAWIVNNDEYEAKKDILLTARSRELAEKASGKTTKEDAKAVKISLGLFNQGFTRKQVAAMMNMTYNTLTQMIYRHTKREEFKNSEEKPETPTGMGLEYEKKKKASEKLSKSTEEPPKTTKI